MRWSIERDINPIDRYFIHIQNLENTVADNNELKQELTQEQWAIRAILEAESKPPIRSSARHLIYVLNEASNTSPEKVREACKDFLAKYVANRSIVDANQHDTRRLTVLATISGIASTWVSLF